MIVFVHGDNVDAAIKALSKKIHSDIILKKHKRETVSNLKLRLFIRKIVQRLKNQGFEHQHDVKRLSIHTGFAFFVSYHYQQRPKQFPVHYSLNFGERIAPMVQLLKTYLPIQQTGLHHVLSLCNDFDARP